MFSAHMLVAFQARRAGRGQAVLPKQLKGAGDPDHIVRTRKVSAGSLDLRAEVTAELFKPKGTTEAEPRLPLRAAGI